MEAEVILGGKWISGVLALGKAISPQETVPFQTV